MAEAFKNLFNKEFFNNFTKVAENVIDDFDSENFIKGIFDEDWEQKELKQRARHTSIVLNENMKGDFDKKVDNILSMIDYIQKSDSIKAGIESMFFPDFIEYFGLDNYDVSIRAMERITQYFSCEFAIRPFLLKYPEKSMDQMQKWSEHEHFGVRRLSSEGCRPRLPWAMALPFLKKDPSPLLTILERLKDDESETVRRSVANNLNDIAKDNPDFVIAFVKKWLGRNENTDWVLKHGSRTLLKQAHPEALTLFGFGSVDQIKIEDFQVLTPKVTIGESLEFSFNLRNTDTKDILIRLEYGLYYLKANGSHSKKVFKISEKKYKGNSVYSILRKQSFRIITTRKFYPGLHKVSLIINGQEGALMDFHLLIQ